MDEAVPPWADDRRVQYKIYRGRDGVSRKEVSVREIILHHGDASGAVFDQFEDDSGAGKVCEFHV